MPPVDAVTRRAVAYLRAHGRNLEGYTRGRAVAERFAYRYSDDELRELGDRARAWPSGRTRCGSCSTRTTPTTRPSPQRACASCSARSRRGARRDARARRSGREARLEAIAREVLGHLPCGFAICEEATHLVPGEGPADARVVLVGEAPGAREDATGRPFVGAAGKLLDLLLEEAGLAAARSSSRTSSRRGRRATATRKPDEVAHHRPWLEAQLEVIAPEVVVPLGRHAMGRFLTGPTITEAHGRVVEADGRRLLPWFHPAAALHDQRLRETLFADARALRDAL